VPIALRDLALRRFAAPGAELRAGLLAKPSAADDLHGVAEEAYTAVWILRGGGWYSDAHGRVCVGAGDLVQRLFGVRHSTWGDAAREWLELYVTLPGVVFTALASVAALDGSTPVLRPGHDTVLLADGERLVANLRQASEVEWPELCARAVALVAALHERHRRRAECDHDGVLAAEGCRLLAAVPERPTPPAAVARQLGLSYERFRKIFAARIGLAPATYQRRRRVEAACNLLLAGEGSVTTVAARLGFPDVYAFTRMFTREVGIPPGRWRRRG